MDEDDESVAPELTPEELKVRRLKKIHQKSSSSSSFF